MAIILRRLVSENKRRYVEHGFDLDLTYITSRIIAMGLPAQGWRRLYRNPMPEVADFLRVYHNGSCKVYNLCIEAAYGYSSNDIGCNLVRYPLYDGQAPPLHIMHAFCDDATTWLRAHASHVVVVHCLAGKGRTGALVSALLLHLAHHEPACAPHYLSVAVEEKADPHIAALAHFCHTRTSDGGLEVMNPSQRRFVGYYSRLLQSGYPGVVPKHVHIPPNSANHQLPNYFNHSNLSPSLGLILPARQVWIQRIVIMGLPQSLLDGPGCTLGIWSRNPGQHAPSLLTRAYFCRRSHVSGCWKPSKALDRPRGPASKAQAVGGSTTSPGAITSQQPAAMCSNHLDANHQATTNHLDSNQQITTNHLDSNHQTDSNHLGAHHQVLPAMQQADHHTLQPPKMGMPHTGEQPAPSALPPATTTEAAGAAAGTPAGEDLHQQHPDVQNQCTGCNDSSGGSSSCAPARAACCGGNLIGSSTVLEPMVSCSSSGDVHMEFVEGQANGALGTCRGVLVLGDFKIQVFKGHRKCSSGAVFKGSGSQFFAWLGSYFLPPSGYLVLGSDELDHAHRRLLKQGAAVQVRLEYTCA